MLRRFGLDKKGEPNVTVWMAAAAVVAWVMVPRLRPYITQAATAFIASRFHR